MRRVILLLALLGLGASCAPISEEACRAGNWTGIGLRDGTKGLPASQVGSYAETCSEFGISPDITAYQAGRAEGLKLYCTPANAYEEGRDGNRLRPVCTPDATLLMRPAHNRGMKYFDIARDMERIEDRIDSRRQLLANSYSGTLTPAQELEAASIRAEIRALDTDLFRLSIQRRRYATWP